MEEDEDGDDIDMTFAIVGTREEVGRWAAAQHLVGTAMGAAGFAEIIELEDGRWMGLTAFLLEEDLLEERIAGAVESALRDNPDASFDDFMDRVRSEWLLMYGDVELRRAYEMAKAILIKHSDGLNELAVKLIACTDNNGRDALRALNMGGCFVIHPKAFDE